MLGVFLIGVVHADSTAGMSLSSTTTEAPIITCYALPVQEHALLHMSAVLKGELSALNSQQSTQLSKVIDAYKASKRVVAPDWQQKNEAEYLTARMNLPNKVFILFDAVIGECLQQEGKKNMGHQLNVAQLHFLDAVKALLEKNIQY